MIDGYALNLGRAAQGMVKREEREGGVHRLRPAEDEDADGRAGAGHGPARAGRIRQEELNITPGA